MREIAKNYSPLKQQALDCLKNAKTEAERLKRAKVKAYKDCVSRARMKKKEKLAKKLLEEITHP
uniref:CagY family CD-EC repeat-containing protein n=1 Tax=Helicobacter pylori TaxID=210 RepID=UPI00403A9C65